MAVTENYSIGKITLSALNDTLDKDLRIAFYRYIGATTAGHKAILQDFGGNYILFESEANGANYTDILPHTNNRLVEGLNLTTLGSGKVEVYLK